MSQFPGSSQRELQFYVFHCPLWGKIISFFQRSKAFPIIYIWKKLLSGPWYWKQHNKYCTQPHFYNKICNSNLNKLVPIKTKVMTIKEWLKIILLTARAVCSMYADLWCGSALILGIKLDFFFLGVAGQHALQTVLFDSYFFLYQKYSWNLFVNQFDDNFYGKTLKYRHSLFESRIILE